VPVLRRALLASQKLPPDLFFVESGSRARKPQTSEARKSPK
jgi:hypothetical protein